MEEFSHTYTDAPVCPHCGYEHQDAWEWSDDEHYTETECQNDECGKWFTYATEHARTFSTDKSCAPDEHKMVEDSRDPFAARLGYPRVLVVYKCTECGRIERKWEPKKPKDSEAGTTS